MALTKQQIYDHALSGMPAWYRESSRAFEFDNAAAEMIANAASTVEYFLITQAFIDTASGATASAPDWLGQHATDRGMSRQAGESDTTLRARIKDVPEALTAPSLKTAIQTILDGESIVGSAAIVDLRQERGFLMNNVPDSHQTGVSGTGGTFTDESTSAAPDQMGFEPDEGWAGHVPYRVVQEDITHVFAGIANLDGGNSGGSFIITGLSGDKILFDNAAGVPEAAPTAKWSVDKKDAVYDQFITRFNLAAGRSDAYFSRGDRMGSQRATIVVILPYGSTAATEASVIALLADKKAAGVKAIVERRINP